MKLNIYQSGGYGINSAINPSGGIIFSTLILSRDPVEALEAATRQYVENKLSNLNANNFTSGVVPVTVLPGFVGDLTSTNGSNILTLSNTGVTPGSYAKVTVNNKGRITAGGKLTNNDIPFGVSFNKVQNRPTTLSGYGITNAIGKLGGSLIGFLTINNNPTQPGHIVNKQYVDNALSSSSGYSVGDIIRRPNSTTPTGFLRCNGAWLSKTTYANLYAVVGDRYSYYLQSGNGKPWKQQYAINTEQSGDITDWTTGTSLPGPLYSSQAVVTKNRVYLLGGHNGTNYVSTVYTAPINTDGTLGTWTTSTPLPGILEMTQAIVTKNRVYLLGGEHAGDFAYPITMYTAPINTDGTLGAWSISTSSVEALYNSQAIVTKNRVYLLGGHDGIRYVSTVYTAPINADGTLGVWSTSTPLPGRLGGSQAIVTKNRVYLLGGYNHNIGGVSTVYTAPINTDGTLGTWTTGPTLPGALYASQAIVTKNRVYLLGGSDYSNDLSAVYTAPINADGTLGAWTTGPSLPGALIDSEAIVTKNRVYLLGGYNFSGYLSTVYTAPILGGLNDYSPYYDGTIIPMDPNNFRLPDMTKDLYSFIKY